MTPQDQPPRYAPDIPLPPYAYVPGGRFPHPVRDPAGHMHSRCVELPVSLDAGNWQSCREYLYGIDLFNHGYYWEAHEAWEGLWHACGRSGTIGNVLQGLIKLAAAGVKAREANTNGVRRHARRAAELFRNALYELGGEETSYMGLRIGDLVQRAEDLANRPPVSDGDCSLPAVEIVFPFTLRPAMNEPEST